MEYLFIDSIHCLFYNIYTLELQGSELFSTHECNRAFSSIIWFTATCIYYRVIEQNLATH